MINLNFKQIQLDLRKWLEERHLSISSQKENLLANVMEELTELVRANSEEEMIDALCDIIVFSTNATNDLIDNISTNDLPIIYFTESKEEFLIEIIDSICCTQHIILTCLANIDDLGYDPIACMNETVKEISSRTGKWNEELGKFKKANGVYNDKESLAKFESNYRTAYPDDNVQFDYYDNRVDVILDYGKEIETYVLWYKANYEKCKKR